MPAEQHPASLIGSREVQQTVFESTGRKADTRGKDFVLDDFFDIADQLVDAIAVSVKVRAVGIWSRASAFRGPAISGHGGG